MHFTSAHPKSSLDSNFLRRALKKLLLAGNDNGQETVLLGRQQVSCVDMRGSECGDWWILL
jgi:hypothetical protein